MLSILRRPIYINKKLQYIKYRIPTLRNELYLIYWYPNSETEIHGHDNQCKYSLLKGGIREELYNLNNEYKGSKCIKPYSSKIINNEIGLHKIINNNKYSITYHKYY